jgi:hypothetical protein
MEVFAPVFDENAAELRGGGGKAFSGAPRAFGTPAAKQAGAAPAGVSRRALGDISNKGAGAATGPGKLAAATPRRALGDITNGGAATTLKLAAATKAPAPACCANLPPGSSARTASFVTEAVLAQAALWAADGTEALAGPSGREQRAHEHSAAEAHARARGARLAATDLPFADGAAVRGWAVMCLGAGVGC